jgi:hypothetical protein
LRTSDLVIAIGDNGKTTILKNRWGMDGVVISHEDYNEFIKYKYENNKSNNPSKKKSFLGRILSRIKIFPFN